MTSLKRLQDHLIKHNLHAYLVPKNDAFMSQTLPKSKDHLHQISGFTGSSGFAVIRNPEQKSLFVTDSRYEIAVKSEIDHSVFDVSTKADTISTIL